MPRTPHYARVAARLIASIAEGRYPIGGMLPTEAVLCERFGVSRITVRGAMRELERRGLVARRRGIGTRVTAAGPTEPLVQSAGSLEDITEITAALRFQLIEAREIRTTAAEAARLERAAGERYLRATGLRVDRTDRVRCLTTMYIAPDYAVTPEALDGRDGSIAAWLADRAGDPIVEAYQHVAAKSLTAREARHLDAPARSAVLATHRWYTARSGRLVLVAFSLFPQGRLSARMQRDPLAPLPRSPVRHPTRPSRS